MGKKLSNKEIQKRQEILQETINNAHKEGVVLSAKYLINKMRERGYKMDRMTLYRERKALANQNNFVRDIAESTYSQMIEEIWDGLTNLEEKAQDLSEKQWTRAVMVKKHRPPETPAEEENPNLIPAHSIERRVETLSFQPKAMFLRLQKEIMEQKMALLKGDTMNVSVAFLSSKLNDYKQKLDEKKQEKDGL
jgi:hypothetical protein